MTRLARAYAVFLVVGLTLTLLAEAAPRPYRGFGRYGLGQWEAHQRGQWQDAEKRLQSGKPRVGDDELQVRIDGQISDMDREEHIRDGQTGFLLLAALVSVAFFLLSLRSTIVLRAAGPLAGTVEIVEDEKVEIDPIELRTQMGRIARTRAEAIEALQLQPALRCGHCGRRVKPEVLGRVGRRHLIERGTERRLADGWWWGRLPPGTCASCGSDDLRLA